jgi:hypothetical protein
MDKKDQIILNYKPDNYNAVDIFKYDLPRNLKYVYSYLERHIKIEGSRCPIKEEIAYYTDFGKRAVDEIIKELEKVGLVEIIPQIESTGQKSNIYLLNHPDQVGIKELTPFVEVHAKKLAEKKQKKSAKSAPRKNSAMQNLHSGDAKSAPPY